MSKTEVRCPNCGTSFLVGNGGNAVTELSEGIHYLVPETIRNEHNCSDKANDRMKAFAEAGIDVSKLQKLMQTDANIMEIFSDPNDKVLEQIGKGGFIRNPELFRRWICAQTFALIGDGNGSWTSAVRKRYDTRYVFRQTRNELYLQLKLINKGLNGKDRRFQFFTLDDMKKIFIDLASYGMWGQYAVDMIKRIKSCVTYQELERVINSRHWAFRQKLKYMPQTWLNCYKGAGAYYTLQNIIRTHGFILPSCTDMQSSLDTVESIYKQIVSYSPSSRRWDMLMSLLMTSVSKTHFELKW